ncbi:MAG: antibiotic biosynthesis monooxygenase [Bacteroides sp.]|nr:antibiotic biosynthesis monooxygenase [Bacteroides sp.]
MKKWTFLMMLTVAVCTTAFIGCSSGNNNNNQETVMSKESVSYENNKVRLSLITVDPERLEEYNAFLKEEIEASMRLEPGVLTLYAVAETENPNKVAILEIYADEAAYQQHIKTPHFLKYKEGTLDMVQSLELIDTTPLIPGLKIK